MSIRFRSRFLHATIINILRDELVGLGWVQTPVNFGALPVKVVDYQPDERGDVIETSTVAVSLGDVSEDVDEELGASAGGTRSVFYPIFLDIYMGEQAITSALADDIRDIFVDRHLALINQITGEPVQNARVVVEQVLGPERPQTSAGGEAFKRYWRVVKLGVRLYYQT